MKSELVHINVTGGFLTGKLVLPEDPSALIIFSHGSGSSRLSPRNSFIAKGLQEAGMATFLFDLLTDREDEDLLNRFNIDLLSGRLILATIQLRKDPRLKNLPVGYFGASTGAASALHAAAWLPDTVKAVVSRGGRPDLAETSLPDVKAATLLIVGEKDAEVLEMNRRALELLSCEKSLVVVEGASHLFEEQGTLEQVQELAAEWFSTHLINSLTNRVYAC